MESCRPIAYHGRIFSTIKGTKFFFCDTLNACSSAERDPYVHDKKDRTHCKPGLPESSLQIIEKMELMKRIYKRAGGKGNAYIRIYRDGE